MYDLMGGVGTPDEARQILDAIRELGSLTARNATVAQASPLPETSFS